MKKIFDLSKDIIDQIIFAMEDQEEDFVIDREKGEIISKKALGDVDASSEDRYIDIPEWKPIDGYRLMERFASTLRNPLYRERLLEALSSGRKVFRNFKNILKENPSIEKRWFIFKAQEIKRVVYDWYNQQREILGLERVEPEEEETTDLVLSDFVFSLWEGKPEGMENGVDSLISMYLDALKEIHPGIDAIGREEAKALFRDENSIIVVAVSPAEEIVGFVMGRLKEEDLEMKVIIESIYVDKSYRGIGIGKELLRAFLKKIRETECKTVSVNLSSHLLSFSSFFETFNFSPSFVTLSLKL